MPAIPVTHIEHTQVRLGGMRSGSRSSSAERGIHHKAHGIHADVHHGQAMTVPGRGSVHIRMSRLRCVRFQVAQYLMRESAEESVVPMPGPMTLI